MSKTEKENFYHYTESGLDNIYLRNGFEYVETPRGKGVVIQDMEGLHLAIGQMLAREKKNLTGKEFRFLRHELGLTQAHLAMLLKVDVQTVARWEKDQTQQVSGPAQGLMRLMYEEHINGNKEITETLKQLAELDDQIFGDSDEDVTFEKDGIWQPTLLGPARRDREGRQASRAEADRHR